MIALIRARTAVKTYIPVKTTYTTNNYSPLKLIATQIQFTDVFHNFSQVIKFWKIYQNAFLCIKIILIKFKSVKFDEFWDFLTCEVTSTTSVYSSKLQTLASTGQRPSDCVC